jgi:hypothetical protein
MTCCFFVLFLLVLAYTWDKPIKGEFSMGKFFGTLIGLFVCFIIFFDLTNGTLPQARDKDTPETIETISSIQTKLPFFERKIVAGDTVLSIIENNLGGPIPVSIDKVVSDFEELNEGASPNKIQIGKTYLFPDYSNE